MIESIHWGVALIPVLVFLAGFIWLDAFKLMSLKEILVLLVIGGICALASWPVSGRLLDTLPIGFSFYSRYVAPWIEEAIKAVAIIILFRMNRVGYKIDAVITGFAIGAGFSVIENMIYLFRFPDYGTGTWLVRGLGTAIMHGTTLAIVGATAHEFAERETREAAGEFDFNLLWFVPGYLVAVGLHMLFNHFPERPLLAMIGAALFAPVALTLIFHFGTSEAQGWLDTEYAAHRVQLEMLRSGKWPDTPNKEKIAELAKRAGPGGKDRISRYWEVLAGLIVEAEETMIEKSAGEVVMDEKQVLAAFTELERLEADLGRLCVAALRRLLPFSRNDYWELSELREHLERSKAPNRAT